jgi:anti-sigma factor RsiW
MSKERGQSDDEPVLAAEDLVAFLDGELDTQAGEAVEAKISLDATIRGEVDALKKTWDLLDFLPRPEPSPNFTERTMSQVQPIQPAPRNGSTRTQSTSSKPPRSTSGAVSNSAIEHRRILIAACWLFAIIGAGCAGYFIRGRIVSQMHSSDDREKKVQIGADRHLLQNLPKYRYVESKENLLSLDDPELFGEEP